MKYFLKTVAFFLIVFFLVSYIIDNWNKAGELKYELNWLYLSFSFLFLLVSLFFLPLALRKIVGVLGYKISIRKMCSVLFYSQIAKYLPGGIWGYVGRMYLYKKEGMSGSDASTCVILETLLVVLSGIFVFIISFSFLDEIPEWMPNEHLDEIGIAVLIVMLFLIHPKTLNFLWGLVPARINKNRALFNYSYVSVLKPALFLVFFWLGIGGGFWLLIRSFIYLDLHLLPVTTGIYILSWIIGFLAFFTPGGLGAREGVLVLALNMYLPVNISVIIAAAARVWWVIGELVWVLFSFTCERFENVKKESC
jgi:uncharacterized membrane protein YbhN (UPF0104 family)